MTNRKGWQVTRFIPGSDDQIDAWFDHCHHRQFSAFLEADLREPEALVRVRWVGF